VTFVNEFEIVILGNNIEDSSLEEIEELEEQLDYYFFNYFKST
jgi:tRNA(Glu) U13 pseudouridine synthase TruD